MEPVLIPVLTQAVPGFNDKFLSVALRCKCNCPLDTTRGLMILVLVSQLFVQRGWDDITLWGD
jgi:hypothetical protein